MQEQGQVIAINEITPKQSTCGPIREVWTLPGAVDYAELRMEPGARTERHLHRRLTEAYLIISGSGIIELGDQEHRVVAGQLCVIPPGTPHMLRAQEPTIVGVICSPPFDPEDVHPLE